MKVVYEPLSIEIDFAKGAIAELVFEDKDFFAQAVLEMYGVQEGAESGWIASLDGRLIVPKKHISIIDNYFLLDPGNSRQVQTALLKNMSEVAESPEYLMRGEDLASKIEQFGLELVDELGFNFEVSTGEGIRIEALLKALNLRIFTESDSLAERVLSAIDVLNSLVGTSLFVMVNLNQFMEQETMDAFVKETRYLGHKMLLLTCEQSNCDVNERVVVDKGQLVI